MHDILHVVDAAELHLYADLAYLGGEGRLVVPHKTPKNGEPPANYKAANHAQAAIRAHGERGFAVLKNWHVLDRFRACPRRVATTAQAVLILSTEGI